MPQRSGKQPLDILGRRAALAALAGVIMAAGLTGCSSSNVFGTSSGGGQPASASSPMSERFSQLFARNTQASAGNPAAPAPDVDCPPVDVRQGASTYSIAAPGIDSPALALRYQGTIGQTARECAALGATMTIKLGVQGRIILGPAGGPGAIDVPMRFAVVREGPEPKTIWTKFYRIPVTVETGQTNVPFVHVEEDLTFPMPSPAELESYVIYIGFDPLGLKQAPAQKPARRR